MDQDEPLIDRTTRRRRRLRIFAHRHIPVRMMVPNLFTLLGLCAGLTSIRMGIEGRIDIAVAAIVFAAFLDGIDGRVARALKASSRFGAELDSLADFVNFGVAPAFLIFNWGLAGNKSLGWICVMMFALASAMRLARFNAALEEEKPRWQYNYFTGVPTPAAAIAVMLPVYLNGAGIIDMRDSQPMVAAMLAYVLLIAVLMVSTAPTYSGKLIGERISRDLVLPAILAAMGVVAMLFTYPYGTLVGMTAAYLISIVWSARRFRWLQAKDAAIASSAPPAAPPAAERAAAETIAPPPGESLH